MNYLTRKQDRHLEALERTCWKNIAKDIRRLYKDRCPAGAGIRSLDAGQEEPEITVRVFRLRDGSLPIDAHRFARLIIEGVQEALVLARKRYIEPEAGSCRLSNPA